jgi:hypothetical protein
MYFLALVQSSPTFSFYLGENYV